MVIQTPFFPVLLVLILVVQVVAAPTLLFLFLVLPVLVFVMLVLSVLQIQSGTLDCRVLDPISIDPEALLFRVSDCGTPAHVTPDSGVPDPEAHDPETLDPGAPGAEAAGPGPTASGTLNPFFFFFAGSRTPGSDTSSLVSPALVIASLIFSTLVLRLWYTLICVLSPTVPTLGFPAPMLPSLVFSGLVLLA